MIRHETDLAFLNGGYCRSVPTWNWDTMEWEGLQNTHTKKAFAFKAPTIEVIDCPGQQSSRIHEDVINRIKEDLFNRYHQRTIKHTQSVTQRIHARPRKRGNVAIKHIAKQCKTDDFYFHKHFGNAENLLITPAIGCTLSIVNTIDSPDND